jgi:SWI/SNF-related matrix-associated actin-dependent regulator of chromatin subfamily A member 5
MGLGKTVQTLALLQFMKEKEGPQAAPSLVICPLSVLETWISEARNWTPGLKLVKYHGPAGDRAKIKALVASGKKVSAPPPSSPRTDPEGEHRH